MTQTLTEELEDVLQGGDLWRNLDLARDAVDDISRLLPSLSEHLEFSLSEEQEELLKLKLLQTTTEFLDAEGISADSLTKELESQYAKAKSQGRSAHLNGKGTLDNPYLDERLHKSWHEGWQSVDDDNTSEE